MSGVGYVVAGLSLTTVVWVLLLWWSGRGSPPA